MGTIPSISMAQEKLVCFAHGKESGPWGTKISYLAEIARRHNWEVKSPDYSHTHDPHERVQHLLDLNPRADRLILAGSSMGAYVAGMACAELKPQALFLMAPAFYFQGWDENPARCPEDTVVVHGWNDDIVPVDVAIRFAQPRKAALHILDSGHNLTDQLPALGQLFETMLIRVGHGEQT